VTVNREENVKIISALVENSSGLSDLPASTAPAALEPSLSWLFVLQEGALIVGLISAILWSLGDEYRRHSSWLQSLEEAREELEELAKKERVAVEHEIAAATFRYYEFFRYRERGAAIAASGENISQVTPTTQPPDREERFEAYYSMAKELEELARKEWDSQDAA
jgi:hypothetical protein